MSLGFAFLFKPKALFLVVLAKAGLAVFAKTGLGKALAFVKASTFAKTFAGGLVHAHAFARFQTFNRALVQRLSDVAFNLTDRAAFARHGERNRDPGAAGSAGTANAVHIIFRELG